MESLLLAAAAAIAVLMIFVGLRRLTAPTIQVRGQLRDYDPVMEESWQESGSRSGDLTGRLDRVVTKRSFATVMARELARADLKLTVTELLLIISGLFVTTTLVVFIITRNVIGAVLIGAVAGFLPRIYIQIRKTRRLNAFNSQLADTSTLLANSLRSGYSLLQAMDMVSREGPSPTAEEFRRVVREVGLGLTPEQALANLVNRLSSDDLDLMVSAINVQHDVGGNLAQILDSISHTIRERVRVKGEIRTLTSQVSCSANLVTAMPLLLTGVLFLLNPAYISQLFQPGPVLCLPAAALGGIVFGWLAMRSITRIEV